MVLAVKNFMQASLAKRWHALSEGTPGRRFRDRYYRQKRSSKSRNLLHTAVRFALAGVAVTIGVVLAVIPGPAIPFFFLAGALVASDWLWMARLLDWIEVKARAVAARVAKLWHPLPLAVKAILLIVGCSFSIASSYLLFQAMR